MKNKFLLLSATILLASTPMLAGSMHTESSATIAFHSIVTKAVSFDEVQQYMAQFGINIVGMSTIEGSENVYARDDKGVNYIVYVTDGVIGGFDEVDF